MRNKFLALFLCVCMILPFEINTSKAYYNPAWIPDRIVLSDLLQRIEENNTDITFSSTYYEWLLENWDSPNNLVVVLIDTDWNFSITTWNTTYTCDYWAMQTVSPYGFKYIHTYQNSQDVTVYEVQRPSTRNIQFKGAYVQRVNSAVTNDVYSGYNWEFTPDFQRQSLPSSTGRQVLASAVNYANLNEVRDNGWRIYFSKDIYEIGDYETPVLEHNLYKESWDILYEFVLFNLGDRKYLTTKNQQIIRGLNEETEDYRMLIGLGFGDDEYEYITYNDTVLIPNATFFITSQLENVSPLGVYAIDVSNWGDVTIQWSSLYDGIVDVDTEIGHAVNLPLSLIQGGEPISDTQSWSYFIEYLNHYNTDLVISRPIVESFFGDSCIANCAVKVFPVERWFYQWEGGISPTPTPIQSPSNCSDIAFWGTPYDVGQGDHGGVWNIIDFDLLDVVIIPSTFLSGSYSGEALIDSSDDYDIYLRHNGYGELWVYTYASDGRLVSDYSFEQLFSMHDGVIILPAQEGIYSFYELVYDPVHDVIDRVNSHPLARDGVKYTSDWDWYSQYFSLDGYLFLNNRAIEKHYLYYFCDGFSKFYDTFSQYMTSERDWKLSFLTFTSALYYKLDSLNGHLTNIDDIISDWAENWGLHIGNIEEYLESLENKFSSALDLLTQIEYNTSERIHDFWILPVYNFILQFRPSMTGFSNWIDAIEDTSENAPPLPVVSVPLLPTMGVHLIE